MKQFQRILYGGDYNPNQWDEATVREDMRVFKAAKINSATINVFSWAKIQPSENQYDFSYLDEIFEKLSQENYDIVLATSTAALPAWLFKRYPEVGRTDFEGRHHKFGQRHNACPNSLVYQKFAKRLVQKLAERYGNHPNLSCWHINNEYGGECFCENCENAFRVWLRNRYQTIEKVNKAWNMEFWGHTLYDWDEIVLPNALSEGIDYQNTAFAGISIDYRRFNSDSMLENFKMERDVIRQFDNETPITTNLMGTYKNLDYFKWAKEMDLVSWDNYPAYDTPWSLVAMTHDLMRGLKNQPFMLMEQTPSQQNWQPYNSLKKPGQMRAQSYQTIAHGGDTVQFFQLRRSTGACEKFHGAVIEHVGHEKTRVFREVAKLGEELQSLGDKILNSENRSEVGLIFDWDNYWALEYTSGPNQDLKYVEQIHQYYQYFYQNNISVDLIATDADFSKYKVIVAPVLYMIKAGVAEALEDFVALGGTLVTTFMSGIVNESDNVHLGGYPGPLRKLAGIWVEEIDALAPGQANQVRLANGQSGSSHLLADIIHLEGATSLGEYVDNFYSGLPIATKNQFGRGSVYYIGTQLDQVSLAMLLKQAEAQADLTTFEKNDLEIVRRHQKDRQYTFIINFTERELKIPNIFIGQKDILTGDTIKDEKTLSSYDVVIVESEREVADVFN